MTEKSWKDHPIVVAAIAVVATIGVCVLLFKDIILPTYSASVNNQLLTIPELQKKIQDLESVLSSTTQQLKDSQHQIKLIHASNLFAVGSPYPTGLSKVRLGDNISALDLHYGSDALTKTEEGFITVKFKHGVFERVVYTFDASSKAKDKSITQISFVLSSNENYTDEFLQDKLIEALGKPKTYTKKGIYSWETNIGVTVFKPYSHMYITLPKGYVPGFWPSN